MAGELQALVDSLGMRLKRAVAIDDPHFRLQAYNSHFGHVDAVRTASIMHRKAPTPAITWLMSLGIEEAQGSMRIPANPSMDMDARICSPIRCQGYLLGFVWLVETEPPLSDEDLGVVDAAAQAAGDILHRERLQGELERSRKRELVRDLLSDQPQLRQHAASELVESHLLVPIRSSAAFVVRPVSPGRSLNDASLVSIELAFDQVRRTVSAHHSLHLVRPDHGLFLVGTEAPSLRPEGVAGLARHLAEATAHQLRGDGDWAVVVGVGETQPQLTDVVGSYGQALKAAHVGEIIPSFRPIAVWSQLGIYRILLQFPIEQLTSSALHPGLLALLKKPDPEPLVQTLERYFDMGCDAKRTAASLRLHRASLYYRLHKIEEIAQLSLHNGDDRLALHLGLKLARLAGILPSAEADGQEVRDPTLRDISKAV